MLIDLSDVLASESREVTAQVPLELAWAAFLLWKSLRQLLPLPT